MTQEKKFAIVRIIFGLVWAVDATLKWMPEVRLHILDVLTQAQQGQPAFEYAWIGFWAHIASFQPVLFGTAIATIETMLAISLITGVCSRLAIILGIPFMAMIWSVPQGFGGPYAPGTTDIDSGFIYLLVFVTLLLGRAWSALSLQNLFKKAPATT